MENNLHWVLEVAFDEVGIKTRRKMAGWSNEYLARTCRLKKTPFDEASINARVQRQRKALGRGVTVTLGETSSAEVMDGHAITVQVGRAAS